MNYKITTRQLKALIKESVKENLKSYTQLKSKQTLKEFIQNSITESLEEGWMQDAGKSKAGKWIKGAMAGAAIASAGAAAGRMSASTGNDHDRAAITQAHTTSNNSIRADNSFHEDNLVTRANHIIQRYNHETGSHHAKVSSETEASHTLGEIHGYLARSGRDNEGSLSSINDDIGSFLRDAHEQKSGSDIENAHQLGFFSNDGYGHR